jgi:hypothetical protein
MVTLVVVVVAAAVGGDGGRAVDGESDSGQAKWEYCLLTHSKEAVHLVLGCCRV